MAVVLRKGPVGHVRHACVEEVSTVELNGNTSIQLDVSFDYEQNLFSTVFVTVDLGNATTLNCDRATGVCALDASSVEVCTQTSGFAALLGC